MFRRPAIEAFFSCSTFFLYLAVGQPYPFSDVSGADNTSRARRGARAVVLWPGGRMSSGFVLFCLFSVKRRGVGDESVCLILLSRNGCIQAEEGRVL